MPAAPSGQLVRYTPGHHEAPHSHEEDEIFIVMEGDLAIGEDKLAPGCLAFVTGGTSYSPRTAAGCTFVRLSLGRT
jgi:hypothetical protein